MTTTLGDHHKYRKPAVKTRRSDAGKTKKYHPGLRRAAGLLYAQTPLTQKQIAETLEVPGTTLERWLKGLELPPHRRGVQGAPPIDQVKALGEEVARLREQVKDYQVRLASMQRDPLATDELIADLRLCLAEKMREATFGEAASGLSAMLRIKEQELRIVALKREETPKEPPAWFREFTEAQARNPLTRPAATEHDLGIIPEACDEDAWDTDPTAEDDEL